MRASRLRRRWSPHDLSPQEAFLLANEEEIRKADAIIQALRPVRLTWLEAAVFHHYYWHALDLFTVAEITERSPKELEAARRTLVTKVAAALGYIEPPAELGPLTMELPMSAEERAVLVEELLAQGLTWRQIGERLGAKPETLRRYHWKYRTRKKAS